MKCRYNPRKEELSEENISDIEKNDEVVQNILREFQFKKYVKNS
jgi:hypothetical protein